ncbi:MAG: GNAT family N-acetyltransferase [Clostridia bacterium]|nr:GNAT family N-acetyltransferase [Clostridia bacterium]
MNEKERLWTLCFGDTAEAAGEFFSIKEVITLTEYSEGSLAGMASLVPVRADNGLSGAYIYGVCVHPDYRGKGIFSRLMTCCENLASESGESFLCLIPADEGIAGAYRRRGYIYPVALFKNEESDGVKISSASAGFKLFARPQGGNGSAASGLLKPLVSLETDGLEFSFSEYMGEC